MGITKSVTRNVVGGITRHLTGPKDIHPHCIFYAPLQWNLRDYISGAYASMVRDGELTYLGKDGLYHTAPADHPGIGKYGVFHDGASTNSLLNNRDLSTGDWTDSLSSKSQDQTGIDGVENKAWTITDNDDANFGEIKQSISITDNSNTHTMSVFVKKDNNEDRFPSFRFRFAHGDVLDRWIVLNTKTGETTDKHSESGSSVNIIDLPAWWRVVISIPNNSSGNDLALCFSYPAHTETWGGGGDASATGSCVIDYPQVELNRSFASSPIETGDTAVSRATQASDAAGNGIRWPFADLDPRVKVALGSEGDGEGTAICEVRLGMDQSVVDQSPGIVSVVDGTLSILRMYEDKRIVTYCATSTYAMVYSKIPANESRKVAVKWSTADNLLKIMDLTDNLSDTEAFDGAFDLGTHLNLFFGNEYPMWLRNLKIFDKPLSDGEIAREAS